MSEVVLKVEHLYKEYRTGKGMLKNLSARDFVIDKFKQMNPFQKYKPLIDNTTFWALHDINFTINRGDTVGFIGRNGAGKSTLLKVLSKITPPTRGVIKSKGRVTSLLEVGTGFHPELTGKENIFLNGSILGLTQKEIRDRYDEIVDFSGVESFLDMPIKRYSSGMRVRLAFAVAAHLDPDILIIDEVLAVGDLDFQKKCLQKMEEVSKSGKTILFVSHNNGHVLKICKKGYLLDQGKMVYGGEIGDVVQTYLNKSREAATIKLMDRKNRKGSGELQIQNINVLDEQGESIETISPNQKFKLVFDYQLKPKFKGGNIVIRVQVINGLGILIFEHNNKFTRRFFKEDELRNNHRFVLSIQEFPFPMGDYFLSYSIAANGEVLDSIEDAIILGVNNDAFKSNFKNPMMSRGTTLLNGEWSLENKSV